MSHGLEHKDERLLAVEGADWRDALARKRRELEADDRDGDDPDSDDDTEVAVTRDPPPGR